ncbi:plasmid mobilization protein [Streptomyces varsoviensis]|uniref:plasmid mobilization protein n=1 Tax=Streptomyces varsoviensis TaxID=67373 RepID=UPI003F4CD815
MHTPNPEDLSHHDRTQEATPAPGGASWGGSIASTSPAPGAAGGDRSQGAPVRKASAEGGPKPGGEANRVRRTSRPKAARRARQRPRQAPEKKRLHQPSTRFNDEEFPLVQAGAAQCGLSIAGFLARSALNAARDLQRTAAQVADEREVITELFAARRQLGWAGSNLNQAVKILNSGGDAPQITAAIADVRRAADRVQQAAAHLLDQRTTPRS